MGQSLKDWHLVCEKGMELAVSNPDCSLVYALNGDNIAEWEVKGVECKKLTKIPLPEYRRNPGVAFNNNQIIMVGGTD